MKRLFRYIQQSLSLRLGLLIVLIITVVFSLLFDFLFYRCKQYIQAKRIAEGHFDEPLPQSPRHDSVGRLQNSFIQMQQSLAQMVSDIRQANEELEQHNEELSQAYQLKLQTNSRKTAFIQTMYHEIRTPLNIISGFAQILAASLHGLPDEEVDDITSRMKQSACDISRLARQLGEVAKDNPPEQQITS